MKQLNNYIIEKLHIGKGFKAGSSDLAADILDMIGSANEDILQHILKWIKDNSVTNVNYYLTSGGYQTLEDMGVDDKHLNRYIIDDDLCDELKGESYKVVYNESGQMLKVNDDALFHPTWDVDFFVKKA